MQLYEYLPVARFRSLWVLAVACLVSCASDATTRPANESVARFDDTNFPKVYRSSEIDADWYWNIDPTFDFLTRGGRVANELELETATPTGEPELRFIRLLGNDNIIQADTKPAIEAQFDDLEWEDEGGSLIMAEFPVDPLEELATDAEWSAPGYIFVNKDSGAIQSLIMFHIGTVFAPRLTYLGHAQRFTTGGKNYVAAWGWRSSTREETFSLTAFRQLSPDYHLWPRVKHIVLQFYDDRNLVLGNELTHAQTKELAGTIAESLKLPLPK